MLKTLICFTLLSESMRCLPRLYVSIMRVAVTLGAEQGISQDVVSDEMSPEVRKHMLSLEAV